MPSKGEMAIPVTVAMAVVIVTAGEVSFDFVAAGAAQSGTASTASNPTNRATGAMRFSLTREET